MFRLCGPFSFHAILLAGTIMGRIDLEPASASWHFTAVPRRDFLCSPQYPKGSQTTPRMATPEWVSRFPPFECLWVWEQISSLKGWVMHGDSEHRLPKLKSCLTIYQLFDLGQASQALIALVPSSMNWG